MQVKVLQNILGANEAIAAENRRLFDRYGTFVVNLMSSPGAGKTSLILRTVKKLRDRVKMAVIEGDVASRVDADKISQEGISVIQINTGGGCHLDANMIRRALEELPLDDIKLLFIENVGNLICPAEFALGEHRKVMILSLPEGDDKPHKYPLMFSEADAIVVNKVDLAPHLDFNLSTFREAVTDLNPEAEILEVSCRSGEGIENWVSWLLTEMKSAYRI